MRNPRGYIPTLTVSVLLLSGLLATIPGCFYTHTDADDPDANIGTDTDTDIDTDSDTDTDLDTDTDTDTDTATDTGPIECNLGDYSGSFTIATQSDVAALAGYTSISGTLFVNCHSCTELSELVCLTSVDMDLWIYENNTLTNLSGLSSITSVGWCLAISDNPALTNLDGLSALTSVNEGMVFGLLIDNNASLTNLDGLSALTSVGDNFLIHFNDILPDCEACDLLDQLTTPPISIEVHTNLDDTCTPVPAGCP